LAWLLQDVEWRGLMVVHSALFVIDFFRSNGTFFVCFPSMPIPHCDYELAYGAIDPVALEYACHRDDLQRARASASDAIDAALDMPIADAADFLDDLNSTADATEAPSRPKCQICKHRPGRRRECNRCCIMVGPCCYVEDFNLCIRCDEEEPEPEKDKTAVDLTNDDACIQGQREKIAAAWIRNKLPVTGLHHETDGCAAPAAVLKSHATLPAVQSSDHWCSPDCHFQG
jgi:hypothetical protein